MDMDQFKRIHDECQALRARLCSEVEQTPEAMLAVASCLLQQVQVIHEAVGGPKLNAALLYAAADKSATCQLTPGFSRPTKGEDRAVFYRKPSRPIR